MSIEELIKIMQHAGIEMETRTYFKKPQQICYHQRDKDDVILFINSFNIMKDRIRKKWGLTIQEINEAENW